MRYPAYGKVSIISDGAVLEGLYQQNTGQRGAVITHPHPLYGGDMYNDVVEAIAEAYRENGRSTLTFNFRGVGMSQGDFDNGIGEQEDVRAAVDYMMDQGMKTVDLAGYSFGAWVNSQAIQKQLPVNRMVMVSPPVGAIDSGDVSPIESLYLVITGSMDNIAPAGSIEKVLSLWNPEAHLEIIEGADHFYAGHTGQLRSIIDGYLKDWG